MLAGNETEFKGNFEVAHSGHFQLSVAKTAWAS